MTLRSKILLALCCVLSLYAALDLAIHQFIIFPSYLALERSEARKDAERCVEALRDEVHHLDVFTNDWASWDDTYRFIQDRNKAYIVSNLGIQTFLDNKLNIIYFCDSKGEVIWGEIRDLESGLVIRLPELPSPFFPENHLLLQHRTLDSSITGIYDTAMGPIMVASRPILTSERKGPVNGSLIMGRFIDNDLKQALSEQTRVDFQLYPVKGQSMSPAERKVLTRITTETPYFFVENDKILNVYTVFYDLLGAPALLLRTDLPRSISATGSVTMRFAVFSNLVVGVVLLMVLLAMLTRVVVRPVSDLTRHAVNIRDGKDLSLRYESNRSDEIGLLGQEFNRMVSQLHAVQQGLETLVGQRTADLKMANEQLKQENTERRRAEQALRTAHDELERQVEQRTTQLRTANAQLQREIESHRRSETELRRYHDKLRSLSSELVLTEERERRRIATELHDRIGQALTLSKLKLDTLLDAEDLAQHAAALNTISSLLEQTIQDARLLTFELSPPVLYELGLEAALEWLLEQIQEQHGLETKFSDDLQPKPLDYPFRVLIFQAVRELLFNVVKHARAHKIDLSVKRENGSMRIDIQDDGVGFDTAQINFNSYKNNGFGLFSIRERLHHLGGRMTVTSEIGNGTHVSLVSPLQRT